MRVLIVDDDPGVRSLVETVLRLARETVEIRTVDSGIEALQQADWPDVVVLDLMMPDVDGLQVAGGMRADRGATVKLVVFSAIADQFAARRPELAALADVVIDKANLSVEALRHAVFE